MAKATLQAVRSQSDSPAGGSPTEDADEILNLALRILRQDLERMDDPGVKVDGYRAMAIANYVRALSGIAKSRMGKGNISKSSVADLIEQALKLPELQDALRGME